MWAVLLSLLVVVIVVMLLLVACHVSGRPELLLSGVLGNTGKGRLGGLVISVCGPFGMWFIAFWVVRRAMGRPPRGHIKLGLDVSTALASALELSLAQLQHCKCFCSILSNGRKIGDDRGVDVQIDAESGTPYVWVAQSDAENPEYQVKINYRGHELTSDSYSPTKGLVTFR